ncbi:MAG: energy-coupling factor transporter transmembrane component T [Actinomycetaceae bacterium]|nr:energy-coupling factor transporter transmembrane component T [Actinomycetaceae bacterium]
MKSSYYHRGLGALDPRTKLLLLIATNVVALTHGTTTMLLVVAVVSMICVASIGAYRYLGGYLVVMFACFVGLQSWDWWPHTITRTIYTGSYFVIRYSVIVNMLVFLFRSTSSSHFVAAAKAAHLPTHTVLSLSVVFRFFPTVAADFRAIREAMMLRGVLQGPLTALIHPVRTTTYVMVPLMTSTLKAGDELTAAALTRGIGGTTQPTSLLQLKATAIDYAIIVLSLTIVIIFVLEKIYM